MTGFRGGSEIRVAIVSGQRVLGESLALALDGCSNIAIDAVVDSARCGSLQSRRIGVIVVDLEGLDEVIELTVPDLRRQAPLAGIIVLASANSEDAQHRTMAAGADGYVSKEHGLADLRRAIYCVAGGVTYLGMRGAAADASDRATGAGGAARLSPREREVLRLLTLGYANRDIAASLHLQHKTVKNHVSSILSKLETSSRTQAVIHALRRGIV